MHLLTAIGRFFSCRSGVPPLISKAMKLTAVFLFAVCMTCAAKGISQKVTLHEKNASLEKVFKEIRKQTGFDFLFSTQELKLAAPVTVSVKDIALEEALRICLSGQPFSFVIENNTIVVKKKEIDVKVEDVPKEEQLTAVEISGRVTNTQGEALAGANVIVKRTGKGTVTTADGTFKLVNVNADDVLIVSYVGYKTLNIKVGSNVSFALIMDITASKLDEVKIQAYGQTSDRLRTGNITTVTAEEIERRPVMNVLTAIQGKVPGLEIKGSGGHESSGFKVEIRGRKFLSNSQSPDPLYIIDGVPLTVLEFNGGSSEGGDGFSQGGISPPSGIRGQSPLFSLNPNDIESITVLKDADATAIYGSRGGKGVIIITTKKGKAGKPSFDVTVYSGISKIPKFYDLMNTKEYVAMRKEALKNDNITPTIGNAGDLLGWDTTRYTNWQKLIWGGTGKVTNVQMSLSGGQRQTTFRIGANYMKTSGVTAISGYNQRLSLQLNVNQKSLDNKLNVSYTSFFSHATVNEIGFSGSQILLPPNAPSPFDASGNLNFKGWDPLTNFYGFAEYRRPPYTSNTLFLNNQLGVKYEILKGLNFTGSFGYNANYGRQVRVNSISAQDPRYNPRGNSNFGDTYRGEWIIEPQLSYNTTISKGKLEIVTGGTAQRVEQKGSGILGSGYVDDKLLYSISNAPLVNAYDFWGQYAYTAIFGRINYNWENKYIANISARRDGSSRFGPGKQFGNFGAVGLAWIFTQSKFFDNHLDWLSFGKLRASFGITGSDDLPDYAFLTRWTASSDAIVPYQGVSSYTATQHANPDLQWQENKKIEIATQLGFFNDKISMEVAWYRDRCDNQLVDYLLPSMTGFTGVRLNLPATVQNSGFEGSLKASIIESTDISWTANLNIGINRNKLISFPNIERTSYYNRYAVGLTLNAITFFHFTGVDPQTGQYTFEDRDRNGVIQFSNGINQPRDTYRKSFDPLYFGGFGTDFTYKGVSVNLFFTYKAQPYVQSAIYARQPGALAANNNQSRQALNHWQKPGDNAVFAKYTTLNVASNTNFRNSDGTYSNGSFVRLANASVSYSMPPNALRKIKVSKMSFFVRGENLFLLTKYNGIDPDYPSLGVLPQLRRVTGGLSITL